jgi:hypothetical protein
MFALPLANYGLEPRFERFRRRVDDRVREETLAAFLPAFQERYEQRLCLTPPDLAARIGPGDELLAGLQSQGWALGRLPEETRRTIRGLVVPIARGMHQTLDGLQKLKFADCQTQLGPVEQPVVEALTEGMQACGAFDAIGAYFGRRLRLQGAVLQVNTAHETRARYGELDAGGRPEHLTSYLHVDSVHWPSIKALIYLDDVGPDQGPFRYVSGSHRLMQPYEAAVRKTNDKLRHSLVELCALPPEYAQHAIFGDHIDPHSPEARALLEKEVLVCDGRSDLILFDNNGVHRGGMVRDGSRCLLQCGFEAA